MKADRQDGQSGGPGACRALGIRTKFLRLRQPVRLGERIDGWRVCWLGGWDHGRVLFVVMVERKYESETETA